MFEPCGVRPRVEKDGEDIGEKSSVGKTGSKIRRREG